MSIIRHITQLFDRFANEAFRRSFLEIVEEGPNRLVLESNRGFFIFDGRRRMISRNQKPVLAFSKIKSIDIVRERETFERTEWGIEIHRGLLRHPLRIGETTDDVGASIIGARLADLTSAKLVPWQERFGFKW
jgi:hypothetical protein